jgi:hypothetical protein
MRAARRSIPAAILVAALVGSVLVVAGGAKPAHADVPYQDISTAGPLEHLYLGTDLSCQVATVIDGVILEFYPPDTIPGDCGTFLSVGGTLYTPDFANHTNSATFFTGAVPFSPVSQTGVTGSGTAEDPYQVVTVADAGGDLRITETDRYVAGEDAYFSQVEVANTGGSDLDAVLYRAADCYLSSSDVGFGSYDVQSGAVGCQEDAGGAPGPRAAELVPLSPLSNFFEGGYFEVWEQIDTRAPFPDTCDCGISQDNGAGLSWNLFLPAGSSETRSHLVRWGSAGVLPPEALFSVIPFDWNGPYRVQFDGNPSFDPDGQVVDYAWDFGDGGSSTEAAPFHDYAAPGTYDISLTVTDDDGVEGTRSDQLTFTGVPNVDFAPEVRIHPDEDHLPMNPYTFIDSSKLVWAHDNACPNDFEVQDVDAALLGSGGYDHRQAKSPFQLCRHYGSRYRTNDYTRPFDGDHPARENIADEEGFYLDFDTDDEPDTFGPHPVWTQTTPLAGNTIVTYWFFSGRSVPQLGGNPLDLFSHEGDWEHVNVELDGVRKVPLLVWYYAHGGAPEQLNWPDIPRSGWFHPAVYSALGSHGSYSSPGIEQVCDDVGCIEDIREDGGPVWETWHDVRPATGQGWYGFGGAWGTKGEFKDTTGPLGPSPYKSPL